MTLVSELRRATRHAEDAGADIEQRLDVIAVHAFATLFPEELPSLVSVAARHRMSAHVRRELVDVIVEVEGD